MFRASMTPEMIGALIAALIWYATGFAVLYFVIKLAVTSGVVGAEKKMAARKETRETHGTFPG